MTKQEAQADIMKQLKEYLHINPKNYNVFCEQQQGASYSLALSSHDNRHCILAKCNNINNPQSMVDIIQF